MQYSVLDTLHVFLIPRDKYQYKFTSLGLLHMTIFLRVEWLQHLFYLIGSRFLWYACTYEGWSADLFTSFIDTNINILWFFLLLRCDISVFLVHTIILTGILFIFICARSHFVVTFQILRLYCLFEVSNCFFDTQFNKFWSNPPLGFCWLSNLFD